MPSTVWRTLATDAVALISLKAAAKPADEDHPYGHGRFETVGTIVPRR